MKKILLYVNSLQNLRNYKKLGGIEVLNFELFLYLKKNYNVVITNKITKKISYTTWDIVLSSNDSRIFNNVNTKKKILWLHNKLQIEKSVRKKQFFSLLRNRIDAIFVSEYLKSKTSIIYNFNKKDVIPNFLPKAFEKIDFGNKKFTRKNKFVWSVKRSRGLNEVINIWINEIYPLYKNAELHIFGIDNNFYKTYYNKNIIYHGNVSRKTLIKNYKDSMGMICLGYDETFCLNAIEAMSAGVPIITLGETALKEMIINYNNGFEINSLNELSLTIKKLINLKNSKRKKLINTCIQYSKKYHFNIIKNKWKKILD